MQAKDRVDGLGTRKLLPLIISMSIPAVCGNITTALYNAIYIQLDNSNLIFSI